MLAHLGEATQQNFDQSRICTRFDELLHVESPAQVVLMHSAQKTSTYKKPIVHRDSGFCQPCCSCLLLCFAFSCLFRQCNKSRHVTPVLPMAPWSKRALKRGLTAFAARLRQPAVALSCLYYSSRRFAVWLRAELVCRE